MINFLSIFYFFFTLSSVATFFCLFGIRKVERFYIWVLLKIFVYAASTIKSSEDKERVPEEEEDKRVDSNQTKSDHSVIQRDVHLSEKGVLFDEGFNTDDPNKSDLAAPCYFVKSGIEAIIEDDVTKRFSAAELEAWNLLSRTQQYQHINWTLTFLWIGGCFARYFILLPFRLIIFCTSLSILITMSIVIGFVPNRKLRTVLNRYTTLVSFRIFVRAFSGVVTYHNSERKAKSDGICVANHTSPIDVIILGCDNVYAMVGQKQGGFMGLIQRAFSCAESHIWFERGEIRDRMAVAKRMKDHVEDRSKLPILVFPEGTCINNTSVMMFKKGSFEVGGTIYPVAIKYDHRFADCFWNSSMYSLLRYLFMMMTSWAIVAEVWYLPPEQQRPDENGIEYAARVKGMIATQGGLVDLEWDGGLKRAKPKDTLKHVQQASYSRIIKTD